MPLRSRGTRTTPDTIPTAELRDPGYDPGRPPQRLGPGTMTVYSDEQLAWLKACDTLRTRLGRVPTMKEIFALALSLGYRRVEK